MSEPTPPGPSSVPPTPTPAIPVLPAPDAAGGPKPGVIGYSSPGLTVPRRPRAVIVVGVVSVLFALASLVVNGVGLAGFRVAWAQVNRPGALANRAPPPPPPPTTIPGLAPHAGETIGPRGLAYAARSPAVEAMRRLNAAVGPDELLMFHRLLAEVGRDVLAVPDGVAAAAPDAVRSVVAGPPATSEVPDGWTVRCAGGTAEITTVSASFVPAAGSAGQRFEMRRDVIRGPAENQLTWSSSAVDAALSEHLAKAARQVTPLQAAAVAHLVRKADPRGAGDWDRQAGALRFARPEPDSFAVDPPG
ncbi:MAG TPA: hypothetical protein VF796_22785, partial [Humisphaera sp.]